MHHEAVVYDLRSDLRNFSTLIWADERAIGFTQLIEVLDGIRIPDSVDRLSVERSPCGYHSSDANTFPMSDTPWLCAGFIVLSRRAVDALSDIISRCGILLPLAAVDLPSAYSLLHVTRVLDALNLQASEYSRFLDGRINQLKKPVFRSELLQDEFLFRIPGYRGGIFATQQFKDRVESCGLTGFEFVQVDPQPEDSADRQRFLERHKRRQR